MGFEVYRLGDPPPAEYGAFDVERGRCRMSQDIVVRLRAWNRNMNDGKEPNGLLNDAVMEIGVLRRKLADAEALHTKARADNLKIVLGLNVVERELKESNEALVLINSQAAAVKASLDAAVDALDHIAHPIERVRKIAEETGGQIDGWAASQLASDANYLRDIATKALRSLGVE